MYKCKSIGLLSIFSITWSLSIYTENIIVYYDTMRKYIFSNMKLNDTENMKLKVHLKKHMKSTVYKF